MIAAGNEGAMTKFERRLRAETVKIGEVTVVFFRDPKKRFWCWRALNTKVKVPKKEEEQQRKR